MDEQDRLDAEYQKRIAPLELAVATATTELKALQQEAIALPERLQAAVQASIETADTTQRDEMLERRRRLPWLIDVANIKLLQAKIALFEVVREYNNPLAKKYRLLAIETKDRLRKEMEAQVLPLSMRSDMHKSAASEAMTAQRAAENALYPLMQRVSKV